MKNIGGFVKFEINTITNKSKIIGELTILSAFCTPKNKIDIKNKIAYINADDLDKYYTSAESLIKEQKQERNSLAVNILSKLFPGTIFTKSDDEDYIPGSLERFIKTKVNKSKLSQEDINAILDLISEFSDTIYLENKQKILALRKLLRNIT